MQREIVSEPEARAAVDWSTMAMFTLVVLFGGLNSVVIRISNAELTPFWGAGVRFVVAGLVFWVVIAVKHLPLPRRRAVLGPLVFGVLSVGTSFGLIYLGLAQIPAGLNQVLLATVPMFTFLFAVAHGLERFHARGLIGSLIAVAGIALAFIGKLDAGVTLLPVLAILAGAALNAEGSVLLKQLPPSSPIVTNAISMTVGGSLLLVVSLLAGEVWRIPVQMSTWLALLYLISFGTVVLFFMAVTIIRRWAVSAGSYVFVLFPFVTVIAANLLAGETVTPVFLLGGALVVMGVWIGAFGPSVRASRAPQKPVEQKTPASK